jgi:hypothetical protein
MVEAAIRSLVISDVNINQIIEGRFYPGVAPQGADTPYVTYDTFNVATATSKVDVSYMDDDIFRINCIAQTYNASITLAGLIRKRLEKYSGTVDGFEIDEIIYEDKRYSFEEGSREDNRLHMVQLDFRVRYNFNQ